MSRRNSFLSWTATALLAVAGFTHSNFNADFIGFRRFSGAGEDDSIGDDGHGCVGDNNGVGNNGGIGGFGENGLVADNESHFRCGMLNRWSALN